MAFIAALPEIAELAGVGAEAGGAAGAAGGAAEAGAAAEGGGGLGGMLKDFNDGPVGKVLGSKMGRAVIGHAVGGDIAGHVERAGGGGGGSSGGTDLGGTPYPD